MPLNINLQQILLHALNFVILFGAMYFLLYKPVKSFMDSRKAHYEKMDEDGHCGRQVERGHSPPARGHKSDQNHDDDGPCVYRDGHHLRPDRGDPHYLRPLMKNTPKKEGL